MKRYLTSILVCMCSNVQALEFSEPLTVTSAQQGVFHHLEASGRSSMAVSADRVAITWEDNSSGVPQVYVAFKDKHAAQFSKPLLVSEAGPAYEPAIALANGQFIVGWEAQDQLWLRVVEPQKRGKLTALGQTRSRQLTFAPTTEQHAMLAWSELNGDYYQIQTAELRLQQGTIKLSMQRAVDVTTDRKQQLYPTLAVTKKGTVVGWEDRRQGATRIFTAFAPKGKPFQPYQLLNDFRYSRIQQFGRGTGAMRIVLSSDLNNQVIAVWLDKRDFEQGYDVYAAYSQDGGQSFGSDEKVQDPLGDSTPQWHATIAMNQNGQTIAAWDDTRDGTPDIWYSLRQSGKWSNDEVWPEGDGAGAQTLPVLVFEQQTLHLAWLHRQGTFSAIRYTHASME